MVGVTGLDLVRVFFDDLVLVRDFLFSSFFGFDQMSCDLRFGLMSQFLQFLTF